MCLMIFVGILNFGYQINDFQTLAKTLGMIKTKKTKSHYDCKIQILM